MPISNFQSDDTLSPRERAALAPASHRPGVRRADGDIDVDAAVARLAARTWNSSAELRREVGARSGILGRTNSGRLTTGSGRRVGQWRWVAAAAAGVLGVLSVASVWRSSTRPASDHGRAIYVTGIGQQRSISLPDGSRMTLGPQSRVELDDHFGVSTRTLTLLGDAVFEVPNVGRTPFVVRTGDVTTRVLGTKFTVRRYTPHAAGQIAVLSGKISVREHARVAVLAAGMVANLTDSSITTARATDPAAYDGWTRGQIVFDNTPVASVLVTLGRWYGYTFRVPDSAIANQRVTATFKTSSSAEALQDLQDLLGVTMMIKGDTVTMRRQVHPRAVEVPARGRFRDVNPSMEVGR